MAQTHFYETAVTIDHEDGIMLVDTTQAFVVTQLLRCGFTETTRPNSKPYRRFKGAADQLRFRKPKGQRTTAVGKRFEPGVRP